MRRMLVFVLGVGLIVVGAGLSGCGPRLSDEDLGELQTDGSQLPGADEDYELPELKVPEEEESASHTGHSH